MQKYGPIGVASYETQLVEELPKNSRSLSTIENIETELAKQKILLKESTKAKTGQAA